MRIFNRELSHYRARGVNHLVNTSVWII